ncbi:hypothetical protein F5Y02DRAFT_390060 [Annulohypoxylon stygium]|nr:hypothetical protein F5Y02DRAFT_390060 [Annulohypoxylon stygium]
MRRWIPARGSILTGLRGWKLSCSRRFSVAVNDVERVSFLSGSSGAVTIDLHNITKVSSPDPLLIYLPPYSTAFSDKPVELPTFVQRRPIAVVNYRWAGYPKSDDQLKEDNDGWSRPHLSWPTPLHDTVRAYDWIKENLGPSGTRTRRDIYVYGSYLGASLATSLTLTETHPRNIQRIGIRGCVAYNGIYDWTTFLPDHKINQARSPQHPQENILEEIFRSSVEDPGFQTFKQHMKTLFEKPGNLFDPFASSCLFFHAPGLYVPPDFNSTALSEETPSEDVQRDPFEEPLGDPTLLSVEQPRFIPEDPDLLPEDDEESSLGEESELILTKSPKASAYVFPPRFSTLKIPEALLLYSSQPPLPPSLHRGPGRPPKLEGNGFKTQAEDLAKLMRRSINKVELKERAMRDDGADSWEDEAARRVQLEDAGLNPGGFELGREGEALVAAWLEDQMGKS